MYRVCGKGIAVRETELKAIALSDDPAEALRVALREIWHDQDMRSPRRMRYMADVRHPLKPLPLDEKRSKTIHWKPLLPKPNLPDEIECPSCHKLIGRAARHLCFAGKKYRRR
jgi:hypothetical protein